MDTAPASFRRSGAMKGATPAVMAAPASPIQNASQV